MSLAFGRDKRLLRPSQFKAVFDSPGARVPGTNVLLLARQNAMDHPRIGLVIGKKSVKLAVERNRLKRLIRESFRQHQDLIGGWDIVIVARKGLAEAENVELRRQFDKLWKRLQRQTSNPPGASAKAGSAHA